MPSEDLKRLAKIADQMMTDNEHVMLIAAKRCRDILRASGKLWQTVLLNTSDSAPSYEDGFKEGMNAGLREGFRRGYEKGADAGVSRAFNHMTGVTLDKDPDLQRDERMAADAARKARATFITAQVTATGRIRLLKRTVAHCIISFENDQMHLPEVRLVNREAVRLSKTSFSYVEIILTPSKPIPSGRVVSTR